MPQKRHLAEETVAKLRQADAGIVRSDCCVVGCRIHASPVSPERPTLA
jgi:hypothetical protein